MKKNLIMLLAAALFIVTGCKKDDDKAISGEKMTFTSDLGGGAKTAIDGVAMKWTEGDQIMVNGELFGSEISEDGTYAEFTGNKVYVPYRAIYPTSIYQEGQYVLPETQTYDGTNLSCVNPMYAESWETTLEFHNICAMVKLSVGGSGKVTKIVATADKPLCGPFTIANKGTADEPAYYAKFSSNGGNNVTLDCGSGVDLPGTFYIALPQATYGNLTFTVSAKNCVLQDITYENITLEPGKLQPEDETFVPIAVPGDAIPGLFSVGESKRVFFAKGNLWYGEDENGKGKSFHFEENQWNYVTGEFNQAASLYNWNENHVSHFFSSKDEGVAYAEFYSDPNAANGDVLFTNQDATTPNSAFTVDGVAGVWRTLSGKYGSSEWDYLINQRIVNGGTGYGHTCVYATVKNDDGEDVKGLIIFRDGYKGSTTNLTSVPDGCVFLLAAGTRQLVNEGGVDYSLLSAAGYDGYYTASTTLVNNLMNYFKFTDSGVISANGATIYRRQACPVRLVRDYTPSK